MKKEQRYHLERERQCRDMALKSTSPQIRRRHEELAEMHHGQAAEENKAAPAQP
ncbi:MAG: hypothetical protein ACREBP_07500 [Sphingomicrobium sp.]